MSSMLRVYKFERVAIDQGPFSQHPRKPARAIAITFDSNQGPKSVLWRRARVMLCFRDGSSLDVHHAQIMLYKPRSFHAEPYGQQLITSGLFQSEGFSCDSIF